LDPLREIVLHPEHLQTPGDVVEDRLWERVRTLEDHADRPAHRDGIDAAPADVLTLEPDRSVHLEAGNEVVHPVQAADEGVFSPARMTDHRRRTVLVTVHAQ